MRLSQDHVTPTCGRQGHTHTAHTYRHIPHTLPPPLSLSSVCHESNLQACLAHGHLSLTLKACHLVPGGYWDCNFQGLHIRTFKCTSHSPPFPTPPSSSASPRAPSSPSCFFPSPCHLSTPHSTRLRTSSDILGLLAPPLLPSLHPLGFRPPPPPLMFLALCFSFNLPHFSPTASPPPPRKTDRMSSLVGPTPPA